MQPSRYAGPGFFPLDANPAAHISRVPFAHTLGFVWQNGPADRVARVLLPFGPTVSHGEPAGIDPLALLALLDHACSAAVYLALPRPSLIATVDLRCELLQPVPPGADVVGTAQTEYLDDQFAIVRAEAACTRTGQRLALASATFAIGTHPGMAGRDIDPCAWHRPPAPQEHHAGFRAMLGLQPHGSEWHLPFHPRLVGAVSLPAVHGGASFAALTLAALQFAERAVEPARRWRPLGLSANYLRAVKADTLVIRPALRKAGPRSCVISASSHQSDPARQAVHAELLLASHDTA